VQALCIAPRAITAQGQAADSESGLARGAGHVTEHIMDRIILLCIVLVVVLSVLLVWWKAVFWLG